MVGRVEELIFQQAARVPHNVAVVCGGEQMTYAGLEKRARQISQALRDMGLQEGQTVGVYAEKSVNTPALMLGIWHAGGVLLPIDASAPHEVLKQIIADSSLRAALVASHLSPKLKEAATSAGISELPVILLDDEQKGDSAIESHVKTLEGVFDSGTLASPLTAYQDDTCYIFYTSGSQARPKGVEGLHSSLLQYLQWQAKEFEIQPDDSFSQVAPLSFDFSLKELLVPLIRGARVCLADRATVIDPEQFLEWVEQNGITVMCCVPALFRAVTQHRGFKSKRAGGFLEKMRMILISGDILRWEDVRRWRERYGDAVSLINLYGPTESTVIKLFYRIPDEPLVETQSVPVGQPIEAAQVLIKDENDQNCAAGEIGEVVILSDWIAKGYRTAESNGRNPFTKIFHDGAWIRAYRTGDLGRRLDDGNIEFIGRRDRQVKVRGHRIELDTLEATLSEIPTVNDVAVVVSETSPDALTISCFFTAKDKETDESAVRRYAAQRLLPYMIPGRFIRVDEMPLSTNGKLDRQALAELARRADFGKPSEPPVKGTALEGKILSVWREVLGIERISFNENFFDLGGNSITAIKLLNRLRTELNPELTLKDVFISPTIAEFAERVESLHAKMPDASVLLK